MAEVTEGRILETINLLAFTVPFIAAGAAYASLRERSVAKVLAGIAALGILAAVFVGYSLMYRHLGFPLWMRWFASAAHAEPLPGRPEVRVNTKPIRQRIASASRPAQVEPSPVPASVQARA